MWAREFEEKNDLDAGDFEKFLLTALSSMVEGALARGSLNYGVFDYQITGVDESTLTQAYVRYLTENNRLDLLGKIENKQEQIRKAAIAAEQKRENERIKSEMIAKMLISSGFSFEGYRIVKYSGYISGDDATQIQRSGIFGSDNGYKLTNALVKIRIQALKELKEAAYELGCNAVIGVDFDYLTLEPETASLTGATLYEPYVICVTANGNAVVVEKEE